MTTYSIRPELHIRKDLGLYIAYGIRARCCRRPVFCIADVFARRREALSFAALCNREQPDWRHIYDIIDDVI